MAGYKRTVLERDGVVGFWTFDGDMFDPNTRRLLQNPKVIIDETGNANHAILHTDQDTFDSYRMGYPSLVKTEISDNHSMAFAPLGKVPTYPGLYPKAHLEIPYIQGYDGYGTSFSFECIINKNNQGESNYLYSPLVYRAGVISAGWLFSSYHTTYFEIKIFNDQTKYILIDFSPFFNKPVHLVINWGVVESSPGRYSGHLQIFLNGKMYAEEIFEYFNSPPNTSQSTASWFIANDNTSTNFHDSMFLIDQVAIYNKALLPNEIADHFRKTVSYDELILSDSPEMYYKFDDTFYNVDKTVENYGSNTTKCFLSGEFNRGKPMKESMPFSKSTYFANDGMAYIIRPNDIYNSSIFEVIGDYTVEMFVKILSSNRGVICSLQSQGSPHHGILIQANVKNNNPELGAIQFSENVSLSYTLNSGDSLRFNDGYFHHIAVTRKGNTISLYIDGYLHDTKECEPQQNYQPSKFYLMGSAPGFLNVAGNISEFAVYYKALQPQQIQARASYNSVYKIFGNTTLRGVPFKSTIRVYNHLTGNLIKEVYSDDLTGNYVIYLFDNAKVDLMIFGNEGNNVKYRAFGPIIPSDYIDNYLSL